MIEDAVGGEGLPLTVGATVAFTLGDTVPDVDPVGEVVPVTFMLGDDVS